MTTQIEEVLHDMTAVVEPIDRWGRRKGQWEYLGQRMTWCQLPKSVQRALLDEKDRHMGSKA
jgi:hypothetical protein